MTALVGADAEEPKSGPRISVDEIAEHGAAAAVDVCRVGHGVMFLGDCHEIMPLLPVGSCQLAVTSPPYNLRNSTGGFWTNEENRGRWRVSQLRTTGGYDDQDDDARPRDEYVESQRLAIAQVMRLLSCDGALFYNHKWRTQDGLIEAQDEIVTGFPVRQIIIWERPGGVNHTSRFFLPNYEVIYLMTHPDFKLKPRANGVGCVWKFPPAKCEWHPAPFPVDLPMRAIIAAAKPEAVVLDPFSGSGTTAIAAERTGQPWVAMEKSSEFFEKSAERIAAENAQGKLFT